MEGNLSFLLAHKARDSRSEATMQVEERWSPDYEGMTFSYRMQVLSKCEWITDA